MPEKLFDIMLSLFPAMFAFFKFSEFKQHSDDTGRKKITERELNHLNYKIDKLLSKLEQHDTELASCSDEECVICISAKATMQTFPCGHRVVCRKCFVKTIQVAVSQRLLPLKCVICRTKILRLKQISQTSSECTIRSKSELTSYPFMSNFTTSLVSSKLSQSLYNCSISSATEAIKKSQTVSNKIANREDTNQRLSDTFTLKNSKSTTFGLVNSKSNQSSVSTKVSSHLAQFECHSNESKLTENNLRTLFASRLDVKKANQLSYSSHQLGSHFESSFQTLIQPSFNCFIKSNSRSALVEEKNEWTRADLSKTFSSTNYSSGLFLESNLRKASAANSFGDTSKIKFTNQSSLLFKPSKLSLTILKTKNFFTKGRWSLY